MQKKKLSKLKVKSFITSLTDTELQNVNGGTDLQCAPTIACTGPWCVSFYAECLTAGTCSTSDQYGTASPACASSPAGCP